VALVTCSHGYPRDQQFPLHRLPSGEYETCRDYSQREIRKFVRLGRRLGIPGRKVRK